MFKTKNSLAVLEQYCILLWNVYFIHQDFDARQMFSSATWCCGNTKQLQYKFHCNFPQIFVPLGVFVPKIIENDAWITELFDGVNLSWSAVNISNSTVFTCHEQQQYLSPDTAIQCHRRLAVQTGLLDHLTLTW